VRVRGRTLEVVQGTERPRLRGRIHEIAFFASIPLGTALVGLAGTGAARVAAVIFAVGLTGLFGVSAAYHRGRWSEAARRRMRRLDHSMIYVLIAATYTPFCLVVLPGIWGDGLLAAVWAGAATGVAIKLVSLERLAKTTAALYVVLGWLAALAIPVLFTHLSLAAFVLLVTGGILYTVGAAILAAGRPNPRPGVFGYHEIFHAFGVAAGACHYAAVLLVVVAAR
jgi:hemolysin III